MLKENVCYLFSQIFFSPFFAEHFYNRHLPSLCRNDFRSVTCGALGAAVGDIGLNFVIRTPAKGCPGVPNSKYTLSTKGFSCYWDKNRYKSQFFILNSQIDKPSVMYNI